MHADARIARLASRQHGLVSIRQLARLGLGRGAIRHRLERGRLHSLHAGVYAVGCRAITVDGHLLAAVMACGAEAGLSHDHAVHVWGLAPPWADPDLASIHVTVPPGSGRGRRPGIVVHRSALAAGERTVHRGIPVTSPARTLIDYASRVDLRRLERAVDQAVTDRLVEVAGLHAAAARHGHRPGGAQLRRLLAAAGRYDSLTRSELEEAFLGLVRNAQLPPPSLNARIEGMLVDAAWCRERVAVELDGYRWHRTRTRLERDRRRDVVLRSAGWIPLRYSARQVLEQGAVVLADVAAALARR